MKYLFLACSLIAFSSFQPFAEAATFQCKSRTELDAATAECADNEAYAEAGVLCLEKLKALVSKTQAEAAAAMGASNAAHSGGQENKLAGAENNYGISVGALDRLIQAAKEANAQVGNYISDIYAPEDFHLAEVPGFDRDELLLGDDCYKENRETLLWVEQDIDQIIDDLTAAKKEAAGHGAVSGSGKMGQGSVSSSGKLRVGAKGAPVAGPKGKDPRASDISGTEKKKESATPKK
jgi:hypothetical protein